VEGAAGAWYFETIAGIQGGIVAERLHEISRADVPPTAQRRVAVEVQLLVLQVAPMDEVLILPDAVHHDVAREPLQQRSGPPIGLLEDESAVDLRDAVVIAALDPIGIREADPRASAQAALRPQDRENGILGARRGCKLLVDRREQTDVGTEARAGEFDRRDWLDDTTCIDEVLGHLKQLAPFQKEGPLLRKEQRLPRIERELARVRLDLRNVRLDRAL